MRRSVLVVALVGLLVIQGSVAGAVTGDGGANDNLGNVTANDTANASVSSIFAAAANATDGTTPADSPATDASNESTATDGSDAAATDTTAADGTTDDGSADTTDEESTDTTATATTTATGTTQAATQAGDSDGDASDAANESADLSDLSTAVEAVAASQRSGSSAGSSSPGAAAQNASSGDAAAGATPSASSAQTGDSTGSIPSAASAQATDSTGSIPSAASAQSSDSTGATPSAASAAGATSTGASGAQSGAAPSGATSAVSPDANISVESVSSDVSVGGSGNVSVTIENTGEDATDAVVTFQSTTSDLVFGRSASTSRYVGDWDENETKTIEVSARAAPTADAATYPVQASVSYTDPDGDAAQSAPSTFGVTTGDQQSFSISDISSNLHVGSSGVISGTVTNDGPKTAHDAVLAFSPNGTRDVIPRQSQYVLGDLESGDSTDFTLPVFVNDTTETGERQVPLVVQYYDTDGNPIGSRTVNTQVFISKAQDDFRVTNVDSDLEAGGQGTLSVTMTNAGDDVTESTVSFQSLSGGVLFGQSANTTRYVDEWDAGDQRTFEFDVAAPAATGGQTYPLQASVAYNDSDGQQARAGPVSFGVTPTDGGDFSVVSTTSDVPVGDQGPISVTLENDGDNASEAVVNLQSLTSDIVFGRAANATAFVGDWPAGAQRTVTINATASNQSETRSYPFQASVSYNDSNGNQARAGPFTVDVTPQPQQSFDLSGTGSTLRVGDEGNLTATLTNEGPGDVDNAVVDLVTQSETLSPQETQVSVGSLAAGESANVSIPIEVSDSAQAGQRQFSFVVEYDNQNGDPRRSGTLSTQAEIKGERDAFSVVRANDSSIDAGSSGSVTLNVTNNLDSVVTNLDAKAYADDPLSLSTDEAYLARLAPGETKQITFDVSASGGADAAQYPLSLDVQYDTPSEDAQLSRTYDVPVDVSAGGGGGLLSSLSSVGITGALVLLLVVLGVGWVWSRRT